MAGNLEDVLRQTTIFRRLSPEDRQRLAAVATARTYDKGAAIFNEGDPSDQLCTVVSDRVKVFKTTARGTDMILEIFGPGDPVGAVAVYEARPCPATAVPLGSTTCLRIMSRWGKERVVQTAKDGFVAVDRTTLEAVALS